MKIQGYICDVCGNMYNEDNVAGVKPINPDLFAYDYKYEIVPNKPETCTIHICMECVNKLITNRLKHIDRSKNEELYKSEYKMLVREACKIAHNKHINLYGNRKKR